MTQRAFFAAVLLIGAMRVVAAETTTSLTPVSVDLSFGKLVPEVPPTPRIAGVLIRSSGPWTLTAVFEGHANSVEARRDEIEMRTVGGSWVRLVDGIPVRVAAGEATSDAGAVVHVEIQVKPSAESPFGRRKGTLRFSMGGLQVTAIPLSYEIDLWSRLDTDPRPFDSPAINPARAGLYPYDRRHYLARSNVPWIVEMVITEFKSKRSSTELPPQTMVLLQDGADPQPIVAGQPIVIARGAPTAAGVVIDLQLAIKIDDQALAGGEYSADLNVVIRPDSTVIVPSR